MSDKPYSPRTGGRYERNKDTGKRTRIEGTEQPEKRKSKAPTPAKTAKSAAKPRKGD
ncbi:MAG: hypothetical protein K5905_04280 [Roseibium sp.]|uniref:hypothetical protein n=1 Tax=Roseibium sp. TaxID=1936156 RepID=UPI00262F9F4C|nr:hypothetical protein [Roseibium sp.]MCV0424667.1 hypothetical protein [Roseibium sp.]